MTNYKKFIQIHFLTSFPFSNLNRDDSGLNKTMMFGGTKRLRISSQCLKKHWRHAFTFPKSCRTRCLGWLALAAMRGKKTICQAVAENYTVEMVKADLGLAESDVVSATEGETNFLKALRDAFAKPRKAGKAAGADSETDDEPEDAAPDAQEPDSKKKTSKGKKAGKGKQASLIPFLDYGLVLTFDPEELAEIDKQILACKDQIANNKEIKLPSLARNRAVCADIAMFGRMFSSNPYGDVDGSVAVAHAFTVHSADEEEDYFTAVDDLILKGSGHLNTNYYGAGLFYGYIAIDVAEYIKNRNGDANKACEEISSFLHTILTVAPHGKYNTTASNSKPRFALVERGDAMPRNLADAFTRAITDADMYSAAAKQLLLCRNAIDNFYGFSNEAKMMVIEPVSGIPDGEIAKNIKELCDFAAQR